MYYQWWIIGFWVISLFYMEKCVYDLMDWKLWLCNVIIYRFMLEQVGDVYVLMVSGKCGKVVINFLD